MSGIFNSGVFNNGVFNTDQPPARGNAGYGGGIGLGHPRVERHLRKERERFGISEPVAEVIAQVAARQAEGPYQDEQKRLEELHRELELQGIAWESRYLAALNEIRTRLIDAEIAARLQAKMEQDDIAALMLMAAAVV